MLLNLIDANKISFRESSQLKESRATTPIKSDCEKSPVIDTFDKQKNVDTDASSKAKKKMSKGLKWLFGLGIVGVLAVIAVIKSRPKKISFDEVQKALSEIFEKDFSKEETDVLVKKYTEIYKEKGSDTYYEKFIEQLKNDYGVKNLRTKLVVDNSINNDLYQSPGSFSRGGTITLNPHSMKICGDESGFNVLFHELKHAQQFSQLWSADSEIFIKKLADEMFADKDVQKALQESLDEAVLEFQKEGMSKFEAEEMLKPLLNKKFYDIAYNEAKGGLEPIYQNLAKLDKDTSEYKKGISYLESLFKDREILPTNDKELEEYKNLLCEKEAYKCGENADKLLKYIQQNLK